MYQLFKMNRNYLCYGNVYYKHCQSTLKLMCCSYDNDGSHKSNKYHVRRILLISFLRRSTLKNDYSHHHSKRRTHVICKQQTTKSFSLRHTHSDHAPHFVTERTHDACVSQNAKWHIKVAYDRNVCVKGGASEVLQRVKEAWACKGYFKIAFRLKWRWLYEENFDTMYLLLMLRMCAFAYMNVLLLLRLLYLLSLLL